MSNLRIELESAARLFASSIVQALAKYSLDEVAAASRLPAPTRALSAAIAPSPASARPRSSKGAKNTRAKVLPPTPRATEKGDVAALARQVVELLESRGEMGRKAILEATGTDLPSLQKALSFAGGTPRFVATW